MATTVHGYSAVSEATRKYDQLHHVTLSSKTCSCALGNVRHLHCGCDIDFVFASENKAFPIYLCVSEISQPEVASLTFRCCSLYHTQGYDLWCKEVKSARGASGKISTSACGLQYHGMNTTRRCETIEIRNTKYFVEITLHVRFDDISV